MFPSNPAMMPMGPSGGSLMGPPVAGSSPQSKGLGGMFGGDAVGRRGFKDFLSSTASRGGMMPVGAPGMMPSAPPGGMPMPVAPPMGGAPMMAPPIGGMGPMGPQPMGMGPMGQPPMGAPMMQRPMMQPMMGVPMGGQPQPRPMGAIAPVRFADGGVVPMRTEIRGMPHDLSYITADEAEILELLGGTGERGPGGVRAYPPVNEGGSTGTSDRGSFNDDKRDYGGYDPVGSIDGGQFDSGGIDTSPSYGGGRDDNWDDPFGGGFGGGDDNDRGRGRDYGGVSTYDPIGSTVGGQFDGGGFDFGPVYDSGDDRGFGSMFRNAGVGVSAPKAPSSGFSLESVVGKSKKGKSKKGKSKKGLDSQKKLSNFLNISLPNVLNLLNEVQADRVFATGPQVAEMIGAPSAAQFTKQDLIDRGIIPADSAAPSAPSVQSLDGFSLDEPAPAPSPVLYDSAAPSSGSMPAPAFLSDYDPAAEVRSILEDEELRAKAAAVPGKIYGSDSLPADPFAGLDEFVPKAGTFGIEPGGDLLRPPASAGDVYSDEVRAELSPEGQAAFEAALAAQRAETEALEAATPINREGILPFMSSVAPKRGIQYGLSDAEVRNMGGGDAGVGRIDVVDYGVADPLYAEKFESLGNVVEGRPDYPESGDYRLDGLYNYFFGPSDPGFGSRGFDSLQDPLLEGDVSSVLPPPPSRGVYDPFEGLDEFVPQTGTFGAGPSGDSVFSPTNTIGYGMPDDRDIDDLLGLPSGPVPSPSFANMPDEDMLPSGITPAAEDTTTEEPFVPIAVDSAYGAFPTDSVVTAPPEAAIEELEAQGMTRAEAIEALTRKETAFGQFAAGVGEFFGNALIPGLGTSGREAIQRATERRIEEMADIYMDGGSLVYNGNGQAVGVVGSDGVYTGFSHGTGFDADGNRLDDDIQDAIRDAAPPVFEDDGDDWESAKDCPEGYTFDRITRQCVPVEEAGDTGEGDGDESYDYSLTPVQRDYSLTSIQQPDFYTSLYDVSIPEIDLPVVPMRSGGPVTPNVDRFMASFG